LLREKIVFFSERDFESDRYLRLFDKVFKKIIKIINLNEKVFRFIILELLLLQFDFGKIEEVVRLEIEREIIF